MNLFLVGPIYVSWHYSGALKNLFQIWSNFVWFVYHFFSLGVLVRTLFAPWRRLDEGYAKGVEPEKWFETLIVNILMRAVGILIRLLFIVIGLVALVLVIVLLVPVLVIWLLLPFAMIALFVAGVSLLFL